MNSLMLTNKGIEGLRLMRQVVLDTETTGPQAGRGTELLRLVAWNCQSTTHRRHFHKYIKPERDIDAGALAVYVLLRIPRGQTHLRPWRNFGVIDGAELIIHNGLDVGFIDAELQPGSPAA